MIVIFVLLQITDQAASQSHVNPLERPLELHNLQERRRLHPIPPHSDDVPRRRKEWSPHHDDDDVIDGSDDVATWPAAPARRHLPGLHLSLGGRAGHDAGQQRQVLHHLLEFIEPHI